MGLRNTFLTGFITCLLLVGCAGVSLRYFALEGVSYENGVLLADKPQNDLPFSYCKPDEIKQPDGTIKIKRKCVVMLSDDFFKYKADYEDCKMRLNECERYRNSP